MRDTSRESGGRHEVEHVDSCPNFWAVPIDCRCSSSIETETALDNPGRIVYGNEIYVTTLALHTKNVSNRKNGNRFMGSIILRDLHFTNDASVNVKMCNGAKETKNEAIKNW